MRVGVFGGSFNPPHIGHMLALQVAIFSGEIDQIVIVPTFKHALGKSYEVDFKTRVIMCMKTFVDCIRLPVVVSTIEADLPSDRPSYTIDMLEKLQDQRPDWQMRLILGEDCRSEFYIKWKAADQIQKIAPIFSIPRIYFRTGDEHYEISSTQLREAICLQELEKVQCMLSPSVYQMIAKQQLYGYNGFSKQERKEVII